jgi:glycosyltransferase involved in cell wall biosynthesis
MAGLHLITCEFPPLVGGVSEHSRVLAEAAVARGHDVQVWTGHDAAGSPGIRVSRVFGDFSRSDLARADAALDACPAPRRVVVQWVPHGYGCKGLNVAFAAWLRRRARAGDRIDLVVHEPFMDFFGRSWFQPAIALVQRYMTWSAVRSAERVWLTIPGWEARLRFARRRGQPAPRTLPVPGAVPVAHDADAVSALRLDLRRGRRYLLGYFGDDHAFARDALTETVRGLSGHLDAAFVCIGRGSGTLAAAVRTAVPASMIPLYATGQLPRRFLSHHLQACDALVQPYPDGVSGRRTTTISALEHGVPVITTVGALSEPFWRESRAVEAVLAADSAALAGAVRRMLEPARHAAARHAALALYRERFDPIQTMDALLSL